MLVECSDQKYLDFIYKRRKEMDVVNEFIHYIHLFVRFLTSGKRQKIMFLIRNDSYHKRKMMPEKSFDKNLP